MPFTLLILLLLFGLAFWVVEGLMGLLLVVVVDVPGCSGENTGCWVLALESIKA